MNKKGYTLAEALITLGIIGIIAALVVPAANKARPNENKLKFLQTYDAIETQIKNFAQNTRYFPTCQDGFPDPVNPGQTINRCFPDYPLYNTSDGVDNILNTIMDENSTSNNKLCYLLADAMDSNAQVSNDVCTFTTPNGVFFAMTVEAGFRLADRPFMITNIAFDINGNALEGADVGTLNLFNVQQNDNIQDISTFLLYVFSDGSIIPGDTASAYYLATRKASRDSNITNADIQGIVTDKYDNNFNSNISIRTEITDKMFNTQNSFSN